MDLHIIEQQRDTTRDRRALGEGQIQRLPLVEHALALGLIGYVPHSQRDSGRKAGFRYHAGLNAERIHVIRAETLESRSLDLKPAQPQVYPVDISTPRL